MNKHFHLSPLATIIAAAIGLAIDCVTELGGTVPFLYTGIVWLSYSVRQSRWLWITATIVTIITIVGFFMSPPDDEWWKEVVNRSIAIVAFWVTAFLCYWVQKSLAEKAMLNAILEIRVEERTARLRASEERFALAVRGSTDGLWDWNVLTNDVYYSSRMKELLEYNDDEFLNVFATFELHLHPDDRDWVLLAVAEHLQDRKPYDVQYRLRTKSGEYRWFRARGQAIWNDEGQATRMAGSITDVTEEHRLRERYRQAKEAAESANLAKSSFLANMSHEIRTPMNGIIGMSQLLSQTDLKPHQKEYLSTVNESAHILLRLLNDILDFSKIEAGKLELEQVNFHLSGCVARALQLLVLRATEKGLEIACRISPEIPNYLLGDSGRIQQVLVNILSNAVKFTSAGEIYLNVNCESITDDRILLHFSISDTGVGIPADKQAQIFRPFEQAESSTTRRFGGTGLGLTISRQLVEMMNGKMWVESEPGRGSIFHFTAEFGVSPDQHRHEPAKLESLNGLPVLVVDDNFTNRRILSELLIFWHMQPTLVESAEAARNALQSAQQANQPISLVLLDHHMPGEDGFQFAESVSRLHNREACKIIMISSGSLPVEAEICQRVGICRFMTKPVIASDLLDEILRQFAGLPSTRSMQSTLPSAHAHIQPRKVLLVEDNEINRRVAIGLLHSRGHHVFVAENGQEAVNILVEKEFDVVLMDMQMPVMGGLEATIAIRKGEMESGGHVPIVAMTAEALKGDRERCLAAGMDDYVSKPIAPEDMYRAVERFPAVCSAAELGTQISTRENNMYLPRKSEPVHDASHRMTEVETQPAPVSNETLSSAAPVIDWDVAKAQLPGGEDDLKEFVNLVKNELPSLLRSIRQAIDTGDAKLLQRSAHTMKSTVGYFGAKQLAQLALELEQLGIDESLEDITEKLPALEQEVERVLKALDNFP